MELQQTIIHIGYHKCASTYLQHHIFPNLNVNYISLRGQNAQMLHYCEKTDGFDSSILSTWIDARKRSLNTTTILSDEGLSGHLHGYKEIDSSIIANNLKSTYPNAKILIIIRNQFSYMTSLYAFRVLIKGVETRPFEKFLVQEGKRGLFDKLEYQHLIGHYIKLFGSNNVLVLPIEMLAKDNYMFNKRIGDFVEMNINQLVNKNKINSSENRSTKNQNIINIIRTINIPLKLIFTIQKYVVTKKTLNDNQRKYNKFKRKIVPFMNKLLGYNKHTITMPKKIENQLAKKYKTSNLNLQSMIDTDLSTYGYLID